MGILDAESININDYVQKKLFNFLINHQTYGFKWFGPLVDSGYKMILPNEDEIKNQDNQYLAYSINHDTKCILIKVADKENQYWDFATVTQNNFPIKISEMISVDC